MTYDDRTKEELQDELRDRDLPVSGTKDELVERLESDDDEGGGRRGTEDGRLKPAEAARLAARQLSDMRGREVDGIAGFDRLDDGWRVVVDVVEISRVPRATDVIATYEVELDADGELVNYERLRRYVRGRVGEDEL